MTLFSVTEPCRKSWGYHSGTWQSTIRITIIMVAHMLHYAAYPQSKTDMDDVVKTVAARNMVKKSIEDWLSLNLFRLVILGLHTSQPSMASLLRFTADPLRRQSMDKI
jgi:hypothetical protein